MAAEQPGTSQYLRMLPTAVAVPAIVCGLVGVAFGSALTFVIVGGCFGVGMWAVAVLISRALWRRRREGRQ
jgi:type IV secretory pathway TrbD component